MADFVILKECELVWTELLLPRETTLCCDRQAEEGDVLGGSKSGAASIGARKEPAPPAQR